MSNTQLPEFANFMKDFWEFIKAFWKPENNDEYFDRLIAEGDAIWFKYDKDPLIRELLAAFMMSRGRMVSNENG